jgi:hypothetical protein
LCASLLCLLLLSAPEIDVWIDGDVGVHLRCCAAAGLLCTLTHMPLVNIEVLELSIQKVSGAVSPRQAFGDDAIVQSTRYLQNLISSRRTAAAIGCGVPEGTGGSR